MISHGKNVKVFCANANRPFAEGVCRKLWLPLGDCTVTTFADGEVSLTINESVRGSDVFLVQSTCKPVNNNLMEPIAQRIRMQYHLGGLSAAECQKYLDDRMQAADLKRPVFTEAACRTIHSVSQRIPRDVNQLAGSALMLVQRTNENAVEERHVKSILADMEQQRGIRAS